MPLLHLDTYQFRNLNNVSISLDGNIHVIYGDNASGKTSLLEAMHVLCSGKSFLGASPRKMQQMETRDFSLRGGILMPEGYRNQLQFVWQDASLVLKSGGEKISRISEYARFQPVQAVTPASFRIIDESPDTRRRFIDWGVFHVKHDYVETWQRFQRCLSQRNKMLVQEVNNSTISAWNREYVALSEAVDGYREAYVETLKPTFHEMISRLLPESSVQIIYHRGWDPEDNLDELLDKTVDRDRQRGYTFYGPQRAELNLRMGKRVAKDIASRGQKKLITYALYLSQAQIQQQVGNYPGLLLIDDLPSELDGIHQNSVFDLLMQLPMQVVISCIEPDQINRIVDQASKLFHVKQGVVKEVVQ